MAGTTIPKKLREAQAGLAELWTNSRSRQHFLGSGDAGQADFGKLKSLPKSGIALYAELIHNNAQGLMDSIFPACRKLVSAEAWPNLIESYLLECPPDTYHLNSLARKFSKYLEKHAGQTECSRWRFIAELADFEWVELEVEEHPARVTQPGYTELTSQELIATLIPVVNPASACRDYKFQIHDIARMILQGDVEDSEEIADAQGDDDRDVHEMDDQAEGEETWKPVDPETAAAILQPQYKRPVHLVFFRDPVAKTCRSLELGSAARKILAQAQSQTSTYAELLRSALDGTHPDALEEMLEKALGLFAKFHDTGLFIGNVRR